jgi:nucleotide-binding universal stress UspA family protein
MKNFLVGIDFSKGSIKALEYAVMLNKYIDSKITMLYVDKPIPTESIYATVTANYRSELHQRFEQLLNEFRQHIKEPDIFFINYSNSSRENMRKKQTNYYSIKSFSH